MTLYEIDSAMNALVDQETGELMDILAFEALNIEREKKIENVALWYKNLVAEAAAIKHEIEQLSQRKKVLENRSERLLEYISFALKGEKFKTARCVVSFRPSQSLEIDSTDELISWCETFGYDDCIRYGRPEVSKKAVAELIKDGVDVPYARLVKNQNVGVK